jgi:hypothetical protein
MTVYRVEFMLPRNFKCERCFLMWSYLTAHSCWPPCLAPNADEPTCKNQQIYPTCGEKGTAFPEEFHK